MFSFYVKDHDVSWNSLKTIFGQFDCLKNLMGVIASIFCPHVYN